MKQSLFWFSDDSFPRSASLMKKRARRAVLWAFLLCLAVAGTTAQAAQPKSEATLQQEIKSKKLPRSSRLAAHDETQGIVLSIDSATTDVGKGAGKSSAGKMKMEAQAPKAKPKKKAAKAAKAKPAAQSKAKKIKVKPAPKPAPVKTAAPKDWQAELDTAQQALKKDRNDSAAWETRITALSAIGSDEALEQLDDMAEAKPSIPSVHAARAKILERQKDTMEALEAWKRAVALSPDNKAYRDGLTRLKKQLNLDD